VDFDSRLKTPDHGLVQTVGDFAGFTRRCILTILCISGIVFLEVFGSGLFSAIPIRFAWRRWRLPDGRCLSRKSQWNRSLILCGRQLTIGVEERLRIVIQTRPAAIFIADDRGLIEGANMAATELVALRMDISSDSQLLPSLPSCIMSSKTNWSRNFEYESIAVPSVGMAMSSVQQFPFPLIKKDSSKC